MFAETNDLTAEQMEAIVLSEARMEEEVYHTIPASGCSLSRSRSASARSRS